MLVVCNRGMGDAVLVRIEYGAGKDDAIVPNLDAPIRELVGIGILADQPPCQFVDLQPDPLVIVLQSQVFADIALVA